jgi:6-phosphogluconate dehydrogenase
LENVIGSLSESGEARWTIEQAKLQGVAVEIIERSLAYRIRSQTDPMIQKSFTARLIAALRMAFGGHQYRKSEEGV